ncbi:cytochrome P450 2F3-like [Lineus longissimus]|uniref:cytochrome P450 2F3-like n=1 Tax=Lineus longissimus TaxID=88925 RepID=UPI002B4CBE8A
MAVVAEISSFILGNLSTVLLIVVTLAIVVRFLRLPAGTLPVGPKGWPVIGYLQGVGAHIYLHYTELAKQYQSDVVSFTLASRLFVVLNSYDAIKQAFLKQGDVFSGRPESIHKNFIAKGNGLISSEGSKWKAQRKFSLTVLRGFGMGKNGMEEKILDEIGHFLQEVEHRQGAPFDIRDLLSASVSNVISCVVFGHRFKYDDKAFVDLLSRFDENMKYGGALNPVNILPALRHLPGDRWHFHLMLHNVRRVQKFVQTEIDQHRETFEEGNQRDFIDIYLEELKQSKERAAESGNESEFNDEQLKQNILDLFFAGSETTNTTLRWAIIYMMLYPEVQQKIQKELDLVIGRERFPRTEDRARLHYTESVLLEIQRHCTMGPLAIPHTATTDAEFLGHSIPKGAMMIANIWAVHHDPRLWEKPYEFQPERFLDAEGIFRSSEYVIPFSVGRRVCLGEALAKVELYIYFTTLLQRFTLKLPEGAPDPDMKGTYGITRAPHPHSLLAIKRSGCNLDSD